MGELKQMEGGNGKPLFYCCQQNNMDMTMNLGKVDLNRWQTLPFTLSCIKLGQIENYLPLLGDILNSHSE